MKDFVFFILLNVRTVELSFKHLLILSNFV